MNEKDPAHDEARLGYPRHGSSEGSADEKHPQLETDNEESTHTAAERGHVATDKFGRSLVQFDPQAERKLRLKIDLYVLPTVAILYLFCFIDRSNIGKLTRLTRRSPDIQVNG